MFWMNEIKVSIIAFFGMGDVWSKFEQFNQWWTRPVLCCGVGQTWQLYIQKKSASVTAAFASPSMKFDLGSSLWPIKSTAIPVHESLLCCLVFGKDSETETESTSHSVLWDLLLTTLATLGPSPWAESLVVKACQSRAFRTNPEVRPFVHHGLLREAAAAKIHISTWQKGIECGAGYFKHEPGFV